MSTNNFFDFKYAVDNTSIVVEPNNSLETFGNTIINYNLVCEDLDDISKSKVRIGRMQILRPQIIAPSDLSKTILEGFGEEAQKYIEWLEKNEQDIRILRYGYTLRQEAFSEEIISSPAKEVLERVKKDLAAKNDPYSALILGVDSPWDVCLVKLFWTMIKKSVKKNIMEMAQQHLFDKQEGIPANIRIEIERAFSAAQRDRSLIHDLGSLLQRHNVFKLYEDRFFALMRK